MSHPQPGHDYGEPTKPGEPEWKDEITCPNCGHPAYTNSSDLIRCDNCGYEEPDEALPEETKNEKPF